MPPVTAWNEFPALAVVILFLAVIGGGLYTVARWFWGEWCKERDKDRAWRDAQNAAREQATEKQNASWQQTVKELAARWEQQDREQEGTLKAIADAMARMSEKLDRHDERAARIEQHTTPRRRSQ